MVTARGVLRAVAGAALALLPLLSLAQTTYEGPQDAPSNGYFPGSSLRSNNPASCPTGPVSFAQMKACFLADNARTGNTTTNVTYALKATTPGPADCTWVDASAINSFASVTIWECFNNSSPSSPPTQFASSGSSGSSSCSSNRLGGTAPDGTLKCLSLCYSLKDTQVSASIPIDDPAQNVVSACLFQAGKGMCEIEVVDAANFTSGNQLYREGTFVYDGMRCDEDPTSAPNKSAITGGPPASTPTMSTDSSTPTSDDASALGQLQSATSAINAGALPVFDGSNRWALSLTPFFDGAGEVTCTITGFADWAPGILSGVTTLTQDIDLCPYIGYWLDFAYWAFAVLTAWGLWSILYSEESR